MQNNQHADPTAPLQGLEDFVHSVMQEWRVREVALAVVKKNEIIYSQGFGQRDEARGLPVEPTGNDIVFKRAPDKRMRDATTPDGVFRALKK